MRCLILGSTGATGQSLLNLLISDPHVAHVLVINRKKTGHFSDKVNEKVVDDLLMLEESHVGKEIDVAFCCIGTTSAKASRSEFEIVERDLIVHCASVLRSTNCHQFHLGMTGYASNPDSWFFIPRIKGECEMKVSAMNFRRLVIYRPGLLLCDRNEWRLLELMAQKVCTMLDRWKFLSIPTHDLATVMLEKAKILHSSEGDSNSSLTIMSHSEIVDFLQQKVSFH